MPASDEELLERAPKGCPICGKGVFVARKWKEWACSDPKCENSRGPGPGGGWPIIPKVMCRVTETVGTHEFICVLEWHGDEFDKNGNRNPRNYGNGSGPPAKWRRHWFVRHYPTSDH